MYNPNRITSFFKTIITLMFMLFFNTDMNITFLKILLNK